MSVLVVTSVNGVPIRLTEERWEHIQAGHPEMADEEEVLRTVRAPDRVLESEAGELIAARRRGHLHVLVIYRDVGQYDGFVITALFMRRMPRRRVLWRR